MARQYTNNGSTATVPLPEIDPAALAERLGLAFVDLSLFRVDADLFR